jgi:chorismate mutase
MIAKLNIQKISDWLPQQNGPIIISGPCSAESRDQVLRTAKSLAKGGQIDILRAGIWKPRTRPNAFEGVGQITGIKTSTEVATPEHVEQALKAGIDILWVGARTSTNPFSVQAIADALKGIDVPVLVKNPINPDLNLWIGALERINNAGITKLGAVHRGFSTFHEQYRNAPLWEIPLKLKTIFPNLPIINDPSHISGSREHLHSVAQKALDLNMDGLMIESHENPDIALSDAQQQVTPSDFGKLINELNFRSGKSESVSYNTRLEELRSQIDQIDNELLAKIASRIEITREIGNYKKENGVTPFQLHRWKEILATREPYSNTLGLNTAFTDKLLQLLHDESIRVQSSILNKK